MKEPIPAAIPKAHDFEIVDSAVPDAIAGLYRGENLGKRIIRLAQG